MLVRWKGFCSAFDSESDQVVEKPRTTEPEDTPSPLAPSVPATTASTQNSSATQKNSPLTASQRILRVFGVNVHGPPAPEAAGFIDLGSETEDTEDTDGEAERQRRQRARGRKRARKSSNSKRTSTTCSSSSLSSSLAASSSADAVDLTGEVSPYVQLSPVYTGTQPEGAELTMLDGGLSLVSSPNAKGDQRKNRKRKRVKKEKRFTQPFHGTEGEDGGEKEVKEEEDSDSADSDSPDEEEEKEQVNKEKAHFNPATDNYADSMRGA